MRAIVEAIAAVCLWVAGIFVNLELKPELYGMAIGLVVAILIEGIVWLIKERRFLTLYLYSVNPFKPKQLRLTIAYIYKIECHGHFLLVKSKRVNDLYQPVGGVYKYFYPEAKKDFHAMGVLPDNNIKNDKVSEYDLRLYLDNKQNLRKFLKWFLLGTERELDPWREFYEELVVPGILPREHFGYLHYELVGQHYDKIAIDKHFNSNTFKYVDIFIPKYITSAQKEAIDALRDKTSDEYIWATAAEIRRGYTEKNQRIADHAYKMFHTDKLTQ